MTRIAALAAVLALAGCSASDRRPVVLRAAAAPTTAVPSPVVAEPDPLHVRERVVPTTRASRGVPRQRPRATPPPAVPRGDVWAALARCESGMRNLRNYPYSGYYQFLGSTWRSLGYSGEAADYPYEVQRAGAQRLLARSGRNQWPVCGPKVGL